MTIWTGDLQRLMILISFLNMRLMYKGATIMIKPARAPNNILTELSMTMCERLFLKGHKYIPNKSLMQLLLKKHPQNAWFGCSRERPEINHT